jgi:hypothetical protein
MRRKELTDEDRLETAAHELGHVIAYIATETYFSYVWVRGADENSFFTDKHDATTAGCVYSFQHGKMTFDGKRLRCVPRDTTPETWLITLLAGVAGEEVLAGQENPRSIIDVSQGYRLAESAADGYGDFRQAQRWVKQSVEEGYIHTKDVWGMLQYFYNKAYSIVRSRKAFLMTAAPLLAKKGVMWNTEVMTSWNAFHQIEPSKKSQKTKTTLDTKDNAQEEETMQLTELETFVLHDLSTRKVKGGIKDGELQTYYGTLGVGGYYKFAYINGRRYEIRGFAKKYQSILYLLQRMGRVSVDGEFINATAPAVLPPLTTVEVWKKDLTTVVDSFKKTVTAVDTPDKRLSTSDIEHVIAGSPIKNAELRKAFDDIAATVTELNALKIEENSVRQAMDILGRNVSSLKDEWQLRQRFVFELSAPALKAAAVRFKKDYPSKPENWDKMKKKDRKACGWDEYGEKVANDILAAAEAGTLVDDHRLLSVLSYRLKAESAHAAWRIEAARRHPDQGGSVEASASFGAVWDKVEALFPKAAATAVGK